MAAANGPELLGGVVVALLTPVLNDGRLDRDSIDRLVAHALDNGVGGISPLGSTGEGYSLGIERRLEVIHAVRRTAPGGTPVIAGLFAPNPAQALVELAQYAEQGVAAALVAPPAYFPLSADEVRAFYEPIAAASPLPVVLYNIPVFSKIQIPPAVVAELAACPAVIGMKDSGRSLEYFLDVQDALQAAGRSGADFATVTGTDSLLTAYLAAGAVGTICASANVVPAMTVEIVAATDRGDHARAQAIEAKLRQVLRIVRIEAPAGVKAAAAALGLCGPAMIAPRLALAPDQRDALASALVGVLDGVLASAGAEVSQQPVPA
jgi:dihydrodipicolinate synthase/N-acetylneuraminate lyase